MKYRSVITYKHYFESFFDKLEIMVQNKIINTIRYIEEIERIPEKYFKHLSSTKGLYEIRVQIRNDQFRIFSFFDKGKLIILANGFNKKRQKILLSEIRRALKIKKDYENEKQKHKNIR